MHQPRFSPGAPYQGAQVRAFRTIDSAERGFVRDVIAKECDRAASATPLDFLFQIAPTAPPLSRPTRNSSPASTQAALSLPSVRGVQTMPARVARFAGLCEAMYRASASQPHSALSSNNPPNYRVEAAREVHPVWRVLQREPLQFAMAIGIKTLRPVQPPHLKRSIESEQRAQSLEPAAR